jgi:hypothetical protein
MAVMNKTDLEHSILRVEASYRIRLAVPLVSRVKWISGDQPIEAYLLVGSPGRCRLLSAPEVKDDPRLKSLQARIAAEIDAPLPDSLTFHDDMSVALALRLLPVRITGGEPAWRLTLPRVLAALMEITPGKTDIAALVFQAHIELWTIETLTSAMSVPLTELI